jgi:hypothetical protein
VLAAVPPGLEQIEIDEARHVLAGSAGIYKPHPAQGSPRTSVIARPAPSYVPSPTWVATANPVLRAQLAAGLPAIGPAPT